MGYFFTTLSLHSNKFYNLKRCVKGNDGLSYNADKDQTDPAGACLIFVHNVPSELSVQTYWVNVYILENEISNNVVCATSKASDQPVHMHSLIRAFAYA